MRKIAVTVGMITLLICTYVNYNSIQLQEQRLNGFVDITKNGFELVAECLKISESNDYILANDIDELRDNINKTLDSSVIKSVGIITNGIGHGSCVAIQQNLILTAGHCLHHPGSWIEINGKKYEIIEEYDTKYDIGFVRIKGRVPSVKLGEMPNVLDEVYLAGSPYGPKFVNTVTKGIVSYLSRDIWDWVGLLQVDAEGAHGSSGGPLFDINSKVIGICVAGPVDGGGVTLCEPVSHIQEVLDELGLYCQKQ